MTTATARMAGLDALKVMAKFRKDEIVIMHESNRADWPVATNKPELDILMGGAMGKASSFALGVALGAPKTGVWVLDGDGALLMNLGTLVTIAGAKPKNLLHVVYNNDAYDTTGGQPTPNSGRVNFQQMALAAGYPRSYAFSTTDALEKALPDVLSGEGPTMLVLQIESRGRLPAASGLRRFSEAYDYLRNYLTKSS